MAKGSQYKVGIEFLCKQDLYYEGGAKVFTKGKIYKKLRHSSIAGWIFVNDTGIEHGTGTKSGNWKKYFQEIKTKRIENYSIF